MAAQVIKFQDNQVLQVFLVMSVNKVYPVYQVMMASPVGPVSQVKISEDPQVMLEDWASKVILVRLDHKVYQVSQVNPSNWKKNIMTSI